jgi:hypothetical protein
MTNSGSDPKGEVKMRVLFIDFDGVLHPAGVPPGTSLPFEWTEVLATLLDPFDDVRVVIHSSWREHFEPEELRHFLAPLAARLLGAVDVGPKGNAIEQFLHAHPEITDALVLDDQVVEFRPEFPIPLLSCDPTTGLSNEGTRRLLRGWLLGQAEWESPNFIKDPR